MKSWSRTVEEVARQTTQIIRTVINMAPGGIFRAGGKVDFGDSNTGIWLGVDPVDGAPKFDLTDEATSLRWDPTNGVVVAGDGAGITNIDGGNIQAGTITAELLDVEELEAVSSNTGDLTVTGALTMDGASALAKGVVDDVKQWELDQYGLTIYQDGANANNLSFKSLAGALVGDWEVGWLEDGDEASGVYSVRPTTVNGSANLLSRALAYADSGAVTQEAGVALAAAVDEDPSVLLRVGSNSTDTKALVKLYHYSGATPAAGFGVELRLQAESSTTASQTLGAILAEWITATHASRAAQIKLEVNDYGGARAALTAQADGAQALLSVFGVTPVARQSHIADPSGGSTVDAEARSAINAILTALENYGWLKTS